MKPFRFAANYFSCLLVFAVASFAVAPAIAKKTNVHTIPTLIPAFSEKVTDYAVHCKTSANGKVSFFAAAPAGQVISLDNGAWASNIRKSLTVSDGQSFRWRLAVKHGSKVGAVKSTWYARCVPDDMRLPAVTLPGIPTAPLYLMSPSNGLLSTWYSAMYTRYGVPIWWRSTPYAQINPTMIGGSKVATWAPIGVPNPLGDFSTGKWNFWSLDGKAAGSLKSSAIGFDQHELVVNPSGSFVAESYEPIIPVDLSSQGGPAQAVGYRTLIREFSANGKVQWTWRSGSKILPAELSGWWQDTRIVNPLQNVTVGGLPAYDLDHINSISPDKSGYTLSFRNLDAVYHVRKSDGEIDWKLGGSATPASLRLVGDPLGAHPLGGPHDVRTLAGGRISVLDIGLGYDRRPRMVVYKINLPAKTATFERAINGPFDTRTNCAGSAREMKSGDWLVSWPCQPTVEEYSHNGVLKMRFSMPSDSWAYRALPIEAGAVNITSLRSAMDKIAPRSR